MHRYLYNLLTTNPKIENLFIPCMGYNPHFLKNKSIQLMSPEISLILATFFSALYRSLADCAFEFLSGLFMGHTAYLSVHYSVRAFKKS